MSLLTPERIGYLIDSLSAGLVLYASQLCREPEDVVQNAFVKLASQSGIENPKAWLYRIVRNDAISASKSAARRKHREQEFAQLKPRWFETNKQEDKDTEKITKMVQSLSEQEREIVTAHIWGSLTFKDIGSIMGLSESSAHRRYQKALQAIRKQMVAPCQTKN